MKLHILTDITTLTTYEPYPHAKQVIAYLEKQKIAMLFPCHCTSFQVRAAIENRIGIHEEIGCGFNIEF